MFPGFLWIVETPGHISSGSLVGWLYFREKRKKKKYHKSKILMTSVSSNRFFCNLGKIVSHLFQPITRQMRGENSCSECREMLSRILVKDRSIFGRRGRRSHRRDEPKPKSQKMSPAHRPRF